MFNTYTLGENARHSPGLILLMHMIGECADRGLRSFDIGVGEAHYKSFFCKEPEPLFDIFLPLTPRGRLAAPAFRRRVRRQAADQAEAGLVGGRSVPAARSAPAVSAATRSSHASGRQAHRRRRSGVRPACRRRDFRAARRVDQHGHIGKAGFHQVLARRARSPGCRARPRPAPRAAPACASRSSGGLRRPCRRRSTT